MVYSYTYIHQLAVMRTFTHRRDFSANIHTLTQFCTCFFSYVALPLASLTAEMLKNLEIVQNSLQTLIKCATEGPFVESAA